MGSNCEHCGAPLSFRNSYEFEGRSLCGSCLDELDPSRGSEQDARRHSAIPREGVAFVVGLFLLFFGYNAYRLAATPGRGELDLSSLILVLVFVAPGVALVAWSLPRIMRAGGRSPLSSSEGSEDSSSSDELVGPSCGGRARPMSLGPVTQAAREVPALRFFAGGVLTLAGAWLALNFAQVHSETGRQMPWLFPIALGVAGLVYLAWGIHHVVRSRRGRTAARDDVISE